MSSILAITSNNVYRICSLDCQEEYGSGLRLIVDSTGRNYCGNECKEGNFNIKADNICIDTCDENIYYIDNDKKECKLCKDLNINKNYKITNLKEAECLEKKPNNSYYINEKLYLVACYEGFNYLEENNCVQKCSKDYFHEEGNHIY